MLTSGFALFLPYIFILITVVAAIYASIMTTGVKHNKFTIGAIAFLYPFFLAGHVMFTLLGPDWNTDLDPEFPSSFSVGPEPSSVLQHLWMPVNIGLALLGLVGVNIWLIRLMNRRRL